MLYKFWDSLIVAMIIYLSWNNYDSSKFTCIIVTADLHAFKETIYWTWDQKKDFWYLAQNFVVTLVFSGNKFQTLQPLASKVLFFFFSNANPYSQPKLSVQLITWEL